MTSLNQGLERLAVDGPDDPDDVADAELVRGFATVDLVAASRASLSTAERAAAREIARYLIGRAKVAAAHRAWFSIERIGLWAGSTPMVADRVVVYAAAELVQRAGEGRWTVRVAQHLNSSIVTLTWGACTLPEVK